MKWTKTLSLNERKGILGRGYAFKDKLSYTTFYITTSLVKLFYNYYHVHLTYKYADPENLYLVRLKKKRRIVFFIHKTSYVTKELLDSFPNYFKVDKPTDHIVIDIPDINSFNKIFRQYQNSKA